MILLALLAGADARFEAAGVRVGDVLLRGPLLEVRAGALVSGNVVEPLSAPLRVDVEGLALTLEPGVRAARDVDGLRLSAHAPARLRVSTGVEGETLLLKRGVEGWTLEGKALPAEIRVSTQNPPPQQEDPEALMRKMEESAAKMRQSSQRIRQPMRRRVFSGHNPLTGGEAAGSEAVRQLAEVSVSGS